MLAPNILLLCLLGLSSSQLNPFFPSSDLSLSSLRPRLGGGDFLPEDSVTAVGAREQLVRRYHYLQYIKIVYQTLKEEYRRYL